MNFNDIISNAVAQVSATLAPPRTCPRFSFPISAENAAALLLQAYRAEVETRGYSYTPNEDTSRRLAAVGRWLTDASRKPSLLLYGATPGTGKTTTARAVKRMAQALHTSLVDGISTAEDALRIKAAEHFAGWVVPWPDGLAKVSCWEDIKRRQAWADTHPEEAEILDQKEAEKNAAIKAWRAPFEAEIEKARAQAATLKAITPEYVTAQGLADMIRAKRFEDYNRLTVAPFIIIDDIGTEPVAVKDFGNEVLPFTELFLKRYDSRCPTIITSNLPLTAEVRREGDKEQSIRGIYGPRVLDRINEICDKLPYSGGSFRR